MYRLWEVILLRGGWGRLIDLVNGPQARFWGQKSSLFERNQLDKKIKEVESSKFQPNWRGMWIREKIEFWQIEASLSWNGKYRQCSEPNELDPSSLLPKKWDVFIKEGGQLIDSWYEILVKYKLERKEKYNLISAILKIIEIQTKSTKWNIRKQKYNKLIKTFIRSWSLPIPSLATGRGLSSPSLSSAL